MLGLVRCDNSSHKFFFSVNSRRLHKFDYERVHLVSVSLVSLFCDVTFQSIINSLIYCRMLHLYAV